MKLCQKLNATCWNTLQYSACNSKLYNEPRNAWGLPELNVIPCIWDVVTSVSALNCQNAIFSFEDLGEVFQVHIYNNETYKDMWEMHSYLCKLSCLIILLIGKYCGCIIEINLCLSCLIFYLIILLFSILISFIITEFLMTWNKAFCGICILDG